jgi:hypothetical protein
MLPQWAIGPLLPVVALESVALRFEERDLELSTRVENRDAELKPELRDVELLEESDGTEFDEETKRPRWQRTNESLKQEKQLRCKP